MRGFVQPSLILMKKDDAYLYGEAVRKIKIDDIKYYEVYFLKTIPNQNNYLHFTDDFETIKEEDVSFIVPVRSDYESAWELLGILMCEMNKFMVISEPNVTKLTINSDIDLDDIGSVDSYSTVSTGDDDNDSFIDDGSDVEFHESECMCECCKNVNDAKKEYRTWVPSNEHERFAKDLIDRLELSAALENDENIFKDE